VQHLQARPDKPADQHPEWAADAGMWIVVEMDSVEHGCTRRVPSVGRRFRGCANSVLTNLEANMACRLAEDYTNVGSSPIRHVVLSVQPRHEVKVACAGVVQGAADPDEVFDLSLAVWQFGRWELAVLEVGN
jgi:hypothetical protein